MIDLLIVLAPMLAGLPFIWHLRDPGNTALGLRPPPSRVEIAAKQMVRGLLNLDAAMREMPEALAGALAAVAEFGQRLKAMQRGL